MQPIEQVGHRMPQTRASSARFLCGSFLRKFYLLHFESVAAGGQIATTISPGKSILSLNTRSFRAFQDCPVRFVHISRKAFRLPSKLSRIFKNNGRKSRRLTEN